MNKRSCASLSSRWYLHIWRLSISRATERLDAGTVSSCCSKALQVSWRWRLCFFLRSAFGRPRMYLGASRPWGSSTPARSMQEAEMEGWQQRVIDEKRALDERLAKLVAFLSKGEPDQVLWRPKVRML